MFRVSRPTGYGRVCASPLCYGLPALCAAIVTGGLSTTLDDVPLVCCNVLGCDLPVLTLPAPHRSRVNPRGDDDTTLPLAGNLHRFMSPGGLVISGPGIIRSFYRLDTQGVGSYLVR